MKELGAAVVITLVVALVFVSVVQIAGNDGDDERTPTAVASTPTAVASTPTAVASTPRATTTPAATPVLSGAELGQSVANRFGCAACHTVTGEVRVGPSGPSWLGLFGKEETLADGSTVTVNDAYLRESIVDPNAKIVRGFLNFMPADFGEKLSDEQIKALIAYIKTLE